MNLPIKELPSGWPTARDCHCQTSDWLESGCWLLPGFKLVAKRVLYQNPPWDCFGCSQVALITCSLLGGRPLIWKHSPTSSQQLLANWSGILYFSLATAGYQGNTDQSVSQQPLTAGWWNTCYSLATCGCQVVSSWCGDQVVGETEGDGYLMNQPHRCAQ